MRFPDGYNKIYSERNLKKWNKILSLFFENNLLELIANQRTGTRGRILSILASKIFDILEISYKAEPLFNHMEPAHW